MDKISGRIIGRCGFHNWNADHKSAEIGYAMDDELYKRKGMMSEAVTAIIDHGFNEMKLNRIEALVGVGNVASLRILLKSGFQEEGLLRQHTKTEESFVDSLLLSRLYQDYKAESAV